MIGRSSGLAVAVVVVALLAAACQPVKLGGPGAVIGNTVDPVSCPQHQPVPTAPCGPQPQVWAAMNGPYDLYESGDPYSTKCQPGGSSGITCTTGNPQYRASGFAYAIDVAPADVGRTLSLDAYDIGAYPRTVNFNTSGSVVSYDLSDVVTTTGTALLTSASGLFTNASVGMPIRGVFCGSSCSIASVTGPTTAVMSTNATMTGAFGATVGYDCFRSATPFNLSSYPGMSSGNCQTGDDSDNGGQNVDVQVYDNDGSGAASYATPLPGCHFSHSAAEMTRAITTYKNTWATLCTFTPSAAGIYAFRVRNSGIDGMVDTGSGTNAYALRLSGTSGTQLYPLEDHSVFVNAVGSTALIYVADVPAENAGKKLMVDVYDAGDGNGTAYAVLQLKAPPGGTATTPTNTGLIVPAPGVATSCRYNATPSVTEGPETPDESSNCGVVTRNSNLNSGIYNGKWLRFEVTLDPSYTCTTDCRWTLSYNWSVTGLPTDRMVFSAKVVS